MPIDRIAIINTNSINTQKDINTNKIDFSKIVKEKLDQVNDKQVEAENKTIELIKGETNDIHEVMLSVEEARLSLELAVQIRNKIVEAVQELNRMQI